MSSAPQQSISLVKWVKDTHDGTPDIRNEVLVARVRLFLGAVGPDFMFMNNNAMPLWAYITDYESFVRIIYG